MCIFFFFTELLFVCVILKRQASSRARQSSDSAVTMLISAKEYFAMLKDTTEHSEKFPLYREITTTTPKECTQVLFSSICSRYTDSDTVRSWCFVCEAPRVEAWLHAEFVAYYTRIGFTVDTTTPALKHEVRLCKQKVMARGVFLSSSAELDELDSHDTVLLWHRSGYDVVVSAFIPIARVSHTYVYMITDTAYPFCIKK